MKILIEYDVNKDKYYFNFDDYETLTIYGNYSAIERLNSFVSNIDVAGNFINQVEYSDFSIEIEV